jgi:capsular polysaccharide biosynthesis protein
VENDSASQTLGLLHYLRVLRRRWFAVPVGVLLGVLAAVGFLVLTPSTSTAFTSVDLTVVSSEPFNLSRPAAELLNRTTEEQTARSPAVVEVVADDLDRSVADIRSSLEAVLLPDSTVLQLRYTADDPDAAAEGADAIADAFLETRMAANIARVDRILADYDDHLADLRDRLARATEIVNRNRGPEVVARAQADQAVIRAEIDSVLQERSKMAGIDATGGSVIASAADSRVETSPNQPLVLATGLLAGFVLGLIGAFAIDNIDRRIRDRADVEDAGCGPVLATLRGRGSTTPTSGDDVDAVRSVREHLLAAIPLKDAVVSVAEVTTNNEPTDVAVNLAVEMADAGVPTDLVLAEYPAATVAIIRAALGMRISLPSLQDASRFESISHPGLRMFVPGPTEEGENPSTAFVSRLPQSGDGEAAPMTIIALPPGASRSLILASGRLGTAVVTACVVGNTRKGELAELIEDLTSVNAELAGTVLLTNRRPWISRRTRHPVARTASDSD